MNKNIPIAKIKYPFALKRASLFLAIGNTELFLKWAITFGVRYINSPKPNNRKIIFFFLLNFIFFGFPIAYNAQEIVTPVVEPATKEESRREPSLTQSEIRNLKKWEVGGFGATGIISGRINYNLNNNFTIGFAHIHQTVNEWEPRVNIFPGFASLGEREYRNSYEVSMLNLRYYLWEKVPFYVTAGAGRNFIGEKLKSTSYGYLYPDGRFNRYIVVREYTISPYNFVYVGLGFQWVFQSGFLIGTEYFRVNSFNRTSRSHLTYLDPSTLFGLAINAYGTGDEKKMRQTFDSLDLWFGYAFSF